MIFNPVIQGSTGGGNITTPELVIEQVPGFQSGKFMNYELDIDTPVDWHTFFYQYQTAIFHNYLLINK